MKIINVIFSKSCVVEKEQAQLILFDRLLIIHLLSPNYTIQPKIKNIPYNYIIDTLNTYK